MDRKPVSEPDGRSKGGGPRKKKPAGLHVVPRDDRWHIVGTLRVGRRSIRVRESTGFPADQEHWEAANSARFAREAEIRAEVLEGKRPSVAFSVAADQYLNTPRTRPLNWIDVSKLKELERHFKSRALDRIPELEWQRFVEKRQAGNKPQTRERYLAFLIAFLKWCAAPSRGWIKDLPRFDRNPKCRKTRAVARRRVVELARRCRAIPAW